LFTAKLDYGDNGEQNKQREHDKLGNSEWRL
jgi:hypothetical protein